MKFVSYKELKSIEKYHKALVKKALIKSATVAGGIACVLILCVPLMEQYPMFISIMFGVLAMFVFYSGSLYEIKLLKRLKFSDKEIEEIVLGSAANKTDKKENDNA